MCVCVHTLYCVDGMEVCVFYISLLLISTILFKF